MYSMTGFGSSSKMYDPYKINVEIKSLNSKFADVRFKAPAELSAFEVDVRQMTLETGKRGKMEVSLTLEGQYLEGNMSEIDERVFAAYYRQMLKLSDTLGFEPVSIISSIVQLPGVVKLQEFKVDDQMKECILETVREALTNLMSHRRVEGKALAAALAESTQN